MSRFATIVLLLSVAGASLTGQVQYKGCPDLVPTTGANQNTFPMGSGAEWRYHELVPASCLGTTPFKIVDIAFAKGNIATTHPGKYSDFQVRLAHTQSASLSSTFATNLGPCPITVLNAKAFQWVYADNTWKDLGMTCDFGYDGVRNLVIEVRYRGGSSQTLFCWRHTYPRAYTSGTGAYGAATAASNNSGGLKVRFTIDPKCVMTCTEQVKVGASGTMSVVNAPIGDTYQIATSFGQSTTLQLGPGCRICLDLDGLAVLSVLGLPLFTAYSGGVGATGKFGGKFAVPNIPPLVGVCLYHAGITYNRTGVTGCTNTCGTLIIP